MPRSANPATLPLLGFFIVYPTSHLSAFEQISERRSVRAMDLQDPGPDQKQVEQLLTAAARVPDHGKLGPWRFICFQDDARQAFGEHLAQRFRELKPEAPTAAIEAERGRFSRAPLVIAVISSVDTQSRIPEWEQLLSAGAACQNLLIAANLMGFAAQWLTEWYAYDEAIDRALGLNPGERVAGFVYIGSATVKPDERQRPDLQQRIRQWTES
tara:strand:- start:413 stop:1051 length:639 start_codon:yes stop_codon:yes gene_type:complete